MPKRTFMRALFVTGLALAGVWAAMAQAPAQEQALTQSADDAKLMWAPCPSFMPSECRLAVLHGDPVKANADVFLKLPAGTTIPEHWHTSAERMVLVAGEMSVSYKGQAKAVLKPGMYAYGPAKLPHAATCTGSSACVLFIAFESPVDATPTATPAR